MSRRGFTLIEVLLAITLAALLLGGVMLTLGTVARDRQRLAEANGGPSAPQGIADLVRHDLVHGRRIWIMPDGGFAITGYGGLDARTLAPTGRLTRVTYSLRDDALYRSQEYMDDRLRPQPWTELVAAGVQGVAFEPMPGEEDAEAMMAFIDSLTGAEPPEEGVRIPSAVIAHVQMTGGSVDEVIRR